MPLFNTTELKFGMSIITCVFVYSPAETQFYHHRTSHKRMLSAPSLCNSLILRVSNVFMTRMAIRIVWDALVAPSFYEH